MLTKVRNNDPGRHIVYDKEVVYHLVRLWRETGMLGSTRFRAGLPEW